MFFENENKPRFIEMLQFISTIILMLVGILSFASAFIVAFLSIIILGYQFIFINHMFISVFVWHIIGYSFVVIVLYLVVVFLIWLVYYLYRKYKSKHDSFNF